MERSGVEYRWLRAEAKIYDMGETFHQHERGEITDEAFAEAFCHEMALSLSYEQFAHGWQGGICRITARGAIMHKLRASRHRVVVLSIPNRLHTHFWPEEYPEVLPPTISIYRRTWECT